MLKILFIVPNSLNPKQMYLEYPMGAGYICTYLRRLGYRAKILDQHAERLSDDDVVNYALSFQPDIAAFSVMTPCYPRAAAQVKALKKISRNIIIAAGGVHAALFGEALLKDGFDAVFLNEGETDFQKFCIVYDKLGMLLSSDTIKVSQNEDANISHEFPEEYKSLLCTDEIILDRDVYNLELYTHHSILAARGCPFSCRFCCNYSKTFGIRYSRSVESVISEMKMLEDKYNARQIFFADDIFFHSAGRIKQFCKAYRDADLFSSWTAQLRADTIDEETAALMKVSGCAKICLGVESGSQSILDRANKRISVEKIISGIRTAKEVGLRVKTFWIIGLPGGYDEQLKSLDVMTETMPNEISVHQLIPFPGTDYYDSPHKYGITIKDKNDFRSFCYGGLSSNFVFDYLSSDEINSLLDIFSDRLKKEGYVSSDKARPDSEYIYTLPTSKNSLRVFSE